MDSRPKMDDQGLNDDILIVEPSSAPVIDLLSDVDSDSGSDTLHQQPVSSAAAAAASSNWKTGKKCASSTDTANCTFPPSKQQTQPTNSSQKKKQVTTLLLLDSDSDYSDVEWCEEPEPAPLPERAREESGESAHTFATEPETPVHEEGTASPRDGRMRDFAHTGGESWVFDFEKQGETLREEHGAEEAENVVHVEVRVLNGGNESGFEHPPSVKQQSADESTCLGSTVISITEDGGTVLDRSFSEPVTSDPFVSQVEIRIENDGSGDKKDDEEEDSGNRTNTLNDFDSEWNVWEAGKQKRYVISSSSVQPLVSSYEKEKTLSILKGGSDVFTHSQLPEGKEANESNDSTRKRKSADTLACDSGPTSSKYPMIASISRPRNVSDKDLDMSGDSQTGTKQGEEVVCRKSPGGSTKPGPQDIEQMCQQLEQPVRPVLFVKSSQSGIMYSTSFDSLRTTLKCKESNLPAYHKDWSNSVWSTQQSSKSGAWSAEGGQEETPETRQHPRAQLKQAPHTTPSVLAPERPYSEDLHTMHVSDEEDLLPGLELMGCELWGGPVVQSPTLPPARARNRDTAKSSRLTSGASSTHAHTPFRWDDDDEDDDDLSTELQAPSTASWAENTENEKGDDACSSQEQPASSKEQEATHTAPVHVGDDRGSQMQRGVFAMQFSTLQDKTFQAHLKRLQPSSKLLNFLLNAQDKKFSVCGHCVEVGIKSVHLAWGSTHLKMSSVQGVLMVSLIEMVRQNLMESSVFSHPLLQRGEYPAVWSLVTRGSNTCVAVVSLIFLLLIMEDVLHHWKLDQSVADRIRARLKTPIVIAQPGCFWGLNSVYRHPKHACSSLLSGLPLLEWKSPALRNGARGESVVWRDQLEGQFVLLWKSMFQPNFQHPFQKSLHRMYPLCPCEQLSGLDKEERDWWRKVEVKGSQAKGIPNPSRVDNLGLLRFMGHNVFCFLGHETLYISAVELQQRKLLPGNYCSMLTSRFQEHLMLKKDARFMTKTEWTFLAQFFNVGMTNLQQWEETREKLVFTPYGLRQIFMRLSLQQYKYMQHAKAIYYMMTLGHHCSWSLLVTPPTTQLHKVPGYPHPDTEEQPAAMIIPQTAATSTSAQNQAMTTYYDGGGGTPPGVKLVEESLNEALKSTIRLQGLQVVAEPFCNCHLMATQMHKYRFLEFDGVELNHVTQMTLAGHMLHCWKRPDGFYVSVVELKARGLYVTLPGHGYLYSYMLEREKVFLTSISHYSKAGLKLYRLIHIARLHRLYQQSSKAAFRKLARHKFRVKLWKHSCSQEDSGRCDLRPGLVTEPAATAVSSSVDAVMGDEDIVDMEVIDDSDSERPAEPELTNGSDAERPALPPRIDLPETGGHPPSPASSIVDLADLDSSSMSAGEQAEVDNNMSVGEAAEVDMETVVDLDPNRTDQPGPVENRLCESSSSGAGPSGVAVSHERPHSPSSCSVSGSTATASHVVESDRRLHQTDHALTVSSPVKKRLRECLAQAKHLVHHPGRGTAPEAVDVPEHSSVERNAPLVVSGMDDERSVTDLMNMLTEQTTHSRGSTTTTTLDVKFLKACQCLDRKASVFPMYSFLQCLYSAQSPFIVLQQLGQAVVCGKLVLCSYRGGNVFFSFLDLKKAGILTENSLEDMRRELLSQKTSLLSKDARSVLLYELEAIMDILKSSQNVDSLLISAHLMSWLQQKSEENGKRLIHLHKIGHICPQAGSVAHMVQRHNPRMSHVQSAWMRAFRWSQDLEQQLAARRAAPPTRSRCSPGCTALLETPHAGCSAKDGLVVFLRSVDNQEKRVVSSPPAGNSSQYVSLTPLPWEKMAVSQVSCGEKLTSHIKSEAACSEPSDQNTCALHQNAGTFHRKANIASPTESLSANEGSSQKEHKLSPGLDLEVSGPSPITRIKQETVDASVKQEPGSPGSQIMTGSNLSTGLCEPAGSVSLPGSVIPEDEDLRVKWEPGETEHGLHCSCGHDHEETNVHLLSLDSVDIKPELKAVSCDFVNNTHDHFETEFAQLHEDKNVDVASVSSSNTCNDKNTDHGCVTIQFNHSVENQACPVHTSMPEVTDTLIPCDPSKVKDIAKSSMVEGVAVDPFSRQVKVIKDDKKIAQLTEGQTNLSHVVLMGILNAEGQRYMCLGIEGRLYVNWAEVVQELIPDDRVLLFVHAQSLHAYLYLPPDSVNECLGRCFGCDVDLLHSTPWVCVNTLVAIYNMGSGLLPREKFLKRFVDITPESFFFPFFLVLRKT